MDCQRSDLLEFLEFVAALRESARSGDWDRAGELAVLLPLQPMPSTREAVGEFLRSLSEALIVAKASRALSAAALVRINAAAGFNNTRMDLASTRQKFGDSPEF
jgi:hypothetical protein